MASPPSVSCSPQGPDRPTSFSPAAILEKWVRWLRTRRRAGFNWMIPRWHNNVTCNIRQSQCFTWPTTQRLCDESNTDVHQTHLSPGVPTPEVWFCLSCEDEHKPAFKSAVVQMILLLADRFIRTDVYRPAHLFLSEYFTCVSCCRWRASATTEQERFCWTERSSTASPARQSVKWWRWVNKHLQQLMFKFLTGSESTTRLYSVFCHTEQMYWLTLCVCVCVRLAVCVTTRSSGITLCWDDRRRERSSPSPWR